MPILPKDPAKQKQMLIGLLPLLLAFAYYQFYHTGRAAEADELEQHVETLTAKNDASRAVVAAYGTDLPRRLAIYQEHIRQLEQLIPRREDVPELINQITQQAHDGGVELAALNPSAEQPGEFYSRQSYELQILGDYHSVGEYITDIASLPRIVRPSGVKLNVENVGSEPDELPILRAMFRIETYIMPTRDAAVAPGSSNASG